MTARQAPPRIWLVTDERQGDGLLGAVDRLPTGSGIIFRHTSLPPAERRRLYERVRARARRRRHLLLLAGPPTLARRWKAEGWHGHGPGYGLNSSPVHNLREMRAAERAGAALLFVSPVFATRSHPGDPTLGPIRFGLLARQAHRPVIALGGVDAAQFQRLSRLGAYGWAGVDAWLTAQKRKAVPT